MVPAEAAGLPITLQSGGELGVRMAADRHFAVSVPNLSLAIDTQHPNMSEDLIAPRHVFADGWMTPPTSPGLGVELAPGVLKRFATTEIPNPYLDPNRPAWFTIKPSY